MMYDEKQLIHPPHTHIYIPPQCEAHTHTLLTKNYILSRLQYCNSIFSGFKIDKLDKIINRSIRNIYQLRKTGYRYTTITTN